MTALLQHFAADQAERRPEATAVELGPTSLTYAALEEGSNRLAHLLRALGLERGDRVPLFLDKSPAAVEAMHGVLKAGGVYVPLDSHGPPLRVARILDACDPRVVLFQHHLATRLEKVLHAWQPTHRPRLAQLGDGGPHPRADCGPADLGTQPAHPPATRTRADDPAHILFTSGSTGTPKGVVISHRNVTAFVQWAVAQFGMVPQDRVACHSPLHFDLSTFDIYGTLAAGASVHLVPPELNLLPHKLAELMRVRELTQWLSVPSVLTLMAQADVIRPNDFPTLRRLFWCGEVMPTPTLIQWMRRLPHVTFTNLYGPTETTIASSFYAVPECPADPQQPISIGTACAGETLHVLDEHLAPVPAGEVGDLYIGGVGLSQGYWRSEDATRAAFVPSPFSDDPSQRIYRTGDLARMDEAGLAWFLGRTDSQIKSRGYRIELGEVEAALHALPGLEECAVVAVDCGGFEGARICCAYVLRNGGPGPASLRTQLKASLPGYMIPTRWLRYPRLPRNANGKVDRRRIHESFERDAS